MARTIIGGLAQFRGGLGAPPPAEEFGANRSELGGQFRPIGGGFGEGLGRPKLWD